jgi:hypothetical protein
MSANKNILMPREFVNDVSRLLCALENENLSPDTQIICQRLFDALAAKVSTIDKRAEYYKRRILRCQD